LITGKLVEEVAVRLLKLAVTELPKDVKAALTEAYRQETSKVAKSQLKAILDNVELAERTGAPICQDTGLTSFYLNAGYKFDGLESVEDALRKATVRATREVPLRPNSVNPFTQENSGDNTGRYVPQIHWRLVPGDTLEITVLPKGGGSENVSALGMLNPSQGIAGLKKFVVDTVIDAGAKPCPPVIIGVAVGGGADMALNLAKKSLLRPLDEPNLEPVLAKLEQELLEAVNMTGIGSMGLGGKVTALGVKVDYAYRHPASYPVAVVMQCWAARRASAKIYSDGNVEYLTHEVAN